MGTYDGDDFESLEDVPLEEIAIEEAQQAGVRMQNNWIDNLFEGVGFEGRHEHGEYHDQGEAVNEVNLELTSDGARVGTNAVQVLIAEFGRRPGAAMPPHEPIAEWVRRKGIASPGEVQERDGVEYTFDDIVFLIRRKIADEGLPAFAPARLAAIQTEEETIEAMEERFDEAFGE